MTMMHAGRVALASLAALATAASAQVKPVDGDVSAAVEAAVAAMQEAVAEAEPGDDTTAALRFDPAADAGAAVDAALIAAQDSGRHVLVIFGGDWCHDSEAIADLFGSDRFAAMLAARYELVWVHVPYSRDERTIAVARRFGLGDIVGTPTILILTPQGQPTNLEDAPRWRNAASRKPDAIYRHFARAVAPVAAPALVTTPPAAGE